MINKALLTSNTDERSTPTDLYENLNKNFHFTLDPCSTEENHKCKKYFTKKEDGLKQDRNNNIIFMNPPYGKEIGKRIEKACSITTGKSVMLLPARTDTKRFQEIILKKCSRILFIKGRLKFGGSKNSAPFPSIIAIYEPTEKETTPLIYKNL